MSEFPLKNIIVKQFFFLSNIKIILKTNVPEETEINVPIYPCEPRVIFDLKKNKKKHTFHKMEINLKL